VRTKIPRGRSFKKIKRVTEKKKYEGIAFWPMTIVHLKKDYIGTGGYWIQINTKQ